MRGDVARPLLEKYYVSALCALIGLAIADLAILYFRPLMLPNQPLPVMPAHYSPAIIKNLADYEAITDHNIFNQDGVIPPALASGKENTFEVPAVLSHLPLKLLGTIVNFDPKKSICTVNITSQQKTNSFRVGDTIGDMARITKIERRKVTFLNLNNNRMEYIEIPQNAVLEFGMQTAVKPGQLVEQTSKNNFVMRRTDVTRLTKNLASLLQQARVEPVFSPDGVSVEGFRFVGIQPGSIYSKLGLHVGDMIKTVNGHSVDSPTKAMELYNLLKNSSSVQLGIVRNGRDVNLNYTIQ